MFRTDKSLLNEKNFSPSDLIQHIELLIKESKARQRRDSISSNYAWLKSRNLTEDIDDNLDHLNNTVLKLSPESCVAIAVKLDRLVYETPLSPNSVIKAFSQLLEEEQNKQLLEKVKADREKKITLKVEERRGSLSFIFNRKNSIAEFSGSLP